MYSLRKRTLDTQGSADRTCLFSDVFQIERKRAEKSSKSTQLITQKRYKQQNTIEYQELIVIHVQLKIRRLPA
jgi:hypothetical protein